VVRSAAEALAARTGAGIVEADALDPATPAGVFQIAAPALSSRPGDLPAPRIELRLRPDGSGRLASAGGRMLYAAACHLVEVLAGGDLGALEQGVSVTPSFAWNRSCYDLFLTQEGRIRNLDLGPTPARRLGIHPSVNASPIRWARTGVKARST
jgi:hypothetical protein